jgi:DNA-binding MarR family transcriptional regulator
VVNDLALGAADAVAVANDLRPVLLRLTRELRRETAALGVTGGQVSLLVELRLKPGVGVRELAAKEGISPAGLSGHVDRLEAAGLVERRASETDRRRVGLHLTAEGTRVLAAAKRLRTAWLAERLRGLSEDELRAVEAAIAPLSRLLGPRA